MLPNSTNSSSVQLSFSDFYETYAPKLWGLILQFTPAPSQSEAIFINTIIKAWNQLEQNPLPEKQVTARLLRLAGEEGLPTERIKAILKQQ